MKRLRIEHIKCTGCRDCETACSIKHYENEVNPKKSRIRVWLNEEDQKFHPVISGPTASAECTSKYDLIIEGTEYDECILCRAACPSRPWFIEPDTGIALKCDFCGDPPDPNCVAACQSGALTLVEV